VNYKHD